MSVGLHIAVIILNSICAIYFIFAGTFFYDNMKSEKYLEPKELKKKILILIYYFLMPIMNSIVIGLNIGAMLK